MKLTRFCEHCGKELIYIKLPNGRLATCEWEGPVPYTECRPEYPYGNRYVTDEGRIVAGVTPPPDYVTGYGYKVHRCDQ